MRLTPCVGMILLSFVAPLSAQAADLTPTQERDFRVVQQVDDVVYGVDRLSLELASGGRYVYAVMLAQKLSAAGSGPSTNLWQGQYLVECLETPRLRVSLGPPVLGVAVAVAPANGAPDFKSNWLDGTRNAADFACRAIKEPESALRIAQDTRESDGPKDIKVLTCSLADARSGQDKHAYEVRFSDTEGTVALSGVWRRSATVTATEIKLTLSGDYVWRIDRRSGAITMEQPRFGVLGSGQCEIASTVKKF